MTQVLLVVLGSGLALITSFLVEFYKGRSARNDLKNNFKTVLKLEVKNMVTVFDRLTENFSGNRYFPFRIIDQLDRTIVRMDGTRKDAIYLNDERKKEDVLTFLNDVAVFASDLRGIEQFAFNEVKDETTEAKNGRLEFCNQQRQLHLLGIVDLKRRAQDVVNFAEKK